MSRQYNARLGNIYQYNHTSINKQNSMHDYQHRSPWQQFQMENSISGMNELSALVKCQKQLLQVAQLQSHVASLSDTKLPTSHEGNPQSELFSSTMPVSGVDSLHMANENNITYQLSRNVLHKSGLLDYTQKHMQIRRRMTRSRLCYSIAQPHNRYERLEREWQNESKYDKYVQQPCGRSYTSPLHSANTVANDYGLEKTVKLGEEVNANTDRFINQVSITALETPSYVNSKKVYDIGIKKIETRNSNVNSCKAPNLDTNYNYIASSSSTVNSVENEKSAKSESVAHITQQPTDPRLIQIYFADSVYSSVGRTSNNSVAETHSNPEKRNKYNLNRKKVKNKIVLGNKLNNKNSMETKIPVAVSAEYTQTKTNVAAAENKHDTEAKNENTAVRFKVERTKTTLNESKLLFARNPLRNIRIRSSGANSEKTQQAMSTNSTYNDVEHNKDASELEMCRRLKKTNGKKTINVGNDTGFKEHSPKPGHGKDNIHAYLTNEDGGVDVLDGKCFGEIKLNSYQRKDMTACKVPVREPATPKNHSRLKNEDSAKSTCCKTYTNNGDNKETHLKPEITKDKQEKYMDYDECVGIIQCSAIRKQLLKDSVKKNPLQIRVEYCSKGKLLPLPDTEKRKGTVEKQIGNTGTTGSEVKGYEQPGTDNDMKNKRDASTEVSSESTETQTIQMLNEPNMPKMKNMSVDHSSTNSEGSNSVCSNNKYNIAKKGMKNVIPCKDSVLIEVGKHLIPTCNEIDPTVNIATEEKERPLSISEVVKLDSKSTEMCCENQQVNLKLKPTITFKTNLSKSHINTNSKTVNKLCKIKRGTTEMKYKKNTDSLHCMIKCKTDTPNKHIAKENESQPHSDNDNTESPINMQNEKVALQNSSVHQVHFSMKQMEQSFNTLEKQFGHLSQAEINRRNILEHVRASVKACREKHEANVTDHIGVEDTCTSPVNTYGNLDNYMSWHKNKTNCTQVQTKCSVYENSHIFGKQLGFPVRSNTISNVQPRITVHPDGPLFKCPVTHLVCSDARLLQSDRLLCHPPPPGLCAGQQYTGPQLPYSSQTVAYPHTELTDQLQALPAPWTVQSQPDIQPVHSMLHVPCFDNTSTRLKSEGNVQWPRQHQGSEFTFGSFLPKLVQIFPPPPYMPSVCPVTTDQRTLQDYNVAISECQTNINIPQKTNGICSVSHAVWPLATDQNRQSAAVNSEESSGVKNRALYEPIADASQTCIELCQDEQHSTQQTYVADSAPMKQNVYMCQNASSVADSSEKTDCLTEKALLGEKDCSDTIGHGNVNADSSIQKPTNKTSQQVVGSPDVFTTEKDSVHGLGTFSMPSPYLLNRDIDHLIDEYISNNSTATERKELDHFDLSRFSDVESIPNTPAHVTQFDLIKELPLSHKCNRSQRSLVISPHLTINNGNVNQTANGEHIRDHNATRICASEVTQVPHTNCHSRNIRCLRLRRGKRLPTQAFIREKPLYKTAAAFLGNRADEICRQNRRSGSAKKQKSKVKELLTEDKTVSDVNSEKQMVQMKMPVSDEDQSTFSSEKQLENHDVEIRTGEMDCNKKHASRKRKAKKKSTTNTNIRNSNNKRLRTNHLANAQIAEISHGCQELVLDKDVTETRVHINQLSKDQELHDKSTSDNNSYSNTKSEHTSILENNTGTCSTNAVYSVTNNILESRIKDTAEQMQIHESDKMTMSSEAIENFEKITHKGAAIVEKNVDTSFANVHNSCDKTDPEMKLTTEITQCTKAKTTEKSPNCKLTEVKVALTDVMESLDLNGKHIFKNSTVESGYNVTFNLLSPDQCYGVTSDLETSQASGSLTSVNSINTSSASATSLKAAPINDISQPSSHTDAIEPVWTSVHGTVQTKRKHIADELSKVDRKIPPLKIRKIDLLPFTDTQRESENYISNRNLPKPRNKFHKIKDYKQSKVNAGCAHNNDDTMKKADDAVTDGRDNNTAERKSNRSKPNHSGAWENQLPELCCKPCEKQFTSKRALSQHFGSVSHRAMLGLPIVSYECKTCCRAFGTKHTWNKHCQSKIHVHHKEIENLAQDTDYKSTTFAHTCKCKICKEIFASEYWLRLHFQSTHKGLEVVQEPANVTDHHDCVICNRKFASKSGLWQHFQSKMHRNKLKADQEHYKNVREHVCSICKRKFVSEFHLMQHTRSKLHRNIQEVGHVVYTAGIYECRICNREFKSKHNLTTHCKAACHKRRLEFVETMNQESTMAVHALEESVKDVARKTDSTRLPSPVSASVAMETGATLPHVVIETVDDEYMRPQADVPQPQPMEPGLEGCGPWMGNESCIQPYIDPTGEVQQPGLMGVDRTIHLDNARDSYIPSSTDKASMGNNLAMANTFEFLMTADLSSDCVKNNCEFGYDKSTNEHPVNGESLPLGYAAVKEDIAARDNQISVKQEAEHLQSGLDMLADICTNATMQPQYQFTNFAVATNDSIGNPEHSSDAVANYQPGYLTNKNSETVTNVLPDFLTNQNSSNLFAVPLDLCGCQTSDAYFGTDSDQMGYTEIQPAVAQYVDKIEAVSDEPFTSETNAPCRIANSFSLSASSNIRDSE